MRVKWDESRETKSLGICCEFDPEIVGDILGGDESANGEVGVDFEIGWLRHSFLTLGMGRNEERMGKGLDPDIKIISVLFHDNVLKTMVEAGLQYNVALEKRVCHTLSPLVFSPIFLYHWDRELGICIT